MKVRHEQERRCGVWGCPAKGDETVIPLVVPTSEGYISVCRDHVGATAEDLAKARVAMRIIAMRKKADERAALVGQVFGV